MQYLKQLADTALSSSVFRLLTGSVIRLVAAIQAIMNRAYANYLWPEARQKDVYIHWNTRVKCPENIQFGQSVRIGPNCVLGAMVAIKIGDNARISEGVCIETGGLDFSKPPPYPHTAKPIVIGDGVWLGFGSTILGGVTIGDRSIIGSGVVVTKDVPPDSIIVSQPNRAILKKTDRGFP